jgi:hypothetical protein
MTTQYSINENKNLNNMNNNNNNLKNFKNINNNNNNNNNNIINNKTAIKNLKTNMSKNNINIKTTPSSNELQVEVEFNPFVAIKKTIEKDGFGELFVGIEPRIFRAVISGAIQFGTYEITQNLLINFK